MDHAVNDMIHSDLSFLTPEQTEVFSTLQRLFPSISKDVLVVTLTSPDIYYDGIDKLLLLNRCMDEVEAQSQVIDFTSRLVAPSVSDPSSVPSTSRSTKNNEVIKIPSLDGDSLSSSVSLNALQGPSNHAVKDGKKGKAVPVVVVSDAVENAKEKESLSPSVSADALQGPSHRAVKDGKEWIAEAVMVVSDAVENAKEKENDVGKSIVGDVDKSHDASKVGSFEPFLVDDVSKLDYESDSSDSLPEVILLPDDTFSRFKSKKRMNMASSTGNSSGFHSRKCVPDLEITKAEVHNTEQHQKEVSPPQRKVRDGSSNGQTLLNSDHLYMQNNSDVPTTSSQSSKENPVMKGGQNICLESLNKKVSLGASDVGSSSGLPSSSKSDLPPGSNSGISLTCKIHRGIKQCDCKEHLTSKKLHSPHASMLDGTIARRELNSVNSFSQKLDTHNILSSSTTSTCNSQRLRNSEMEPCAHSSVASTISMKDGQIRDNLLLEKTQPSTPQPIKGSDGLTPTRIGNAVGVHTPLSGSSSQAGGYNKETFQNPKITKNTLQTVKQTSAISPIVVKNVGGNYMVIKGTRRTAQSSNSERIVEKPSTLNQAVNGTVHTPKFANATERGSQATNKVVPGRLQEMKQVNGSTSLAGGSTIGTSVVALAGSSASVNHSAPKSQMNQNRKMDTLGKTQTGPVSVQTSYVRDVPPGIGPNFAVIPQPSSYQVSQNNGIVTFGRSQPGLQSSQAVPVILTEAAVVLNPTARPQSSSAPTDQNNRTTTTVRSQAAFALNPTTRPQSSSAQTGQNNITTPGRLQSGAIPIAVRQTQTGINPSSSGRPTVAQMIKSHRESQSPQARLNQPGKILNATTVPHASGMQRVRRNDEALSQHSKAARQLKNNIDALARHNLHGISQANATAPGNTQTVRMAEQVLGNASFLPRNVALNQVQRQNNVRQENGFPLPQRIPWRPPPPPFQNDILGASEIHQGVCQVHGGLQCNCPPPYQDRDIFEVSDQTAVDVSPFMVKVLSLFPDADPDFVKQKLQTIAQSVPDPVQWVCNLILEDAYPRKQVPVRPKTPPPSTSKPKDFDYINKWRELPRIDNRGHYILEARQVLSFAFKLISMGSIDEVMKATRFVFTPAFVILEKIVQSKEYINAEKSHRRPGTYHSTHPTLSINCELPGEVPGLPNGKKFEERRFKIKLNRKPRNNMRPCTNKDLKKEMEYYKNFVREKQEEQDHMMALRINEEEYEQNQQGIECACCFVEHPFENMVQCFEMHLFCSDCLQRYVKEAIYGQGKGNLACMATDCSSTFPRDQIEKTLPPDTLAKYDERCREESVHLADLEDLVRCPHCQFAATLALEIKAFQCPQCGKETCRDCQQDWKDHFGKKCEELESKSEEQLRTKYEEKLTEALIRTCHRCKASIIKENGCNKMTCRCGAKMCYICRKPNIDYNHFCQHVRDPSKKGCNRCNACCLWEVAEVIDEKKMKAIVEEMKEEQKEKGIDERKRTVGAPDNTGAGPSKKPRTQ